MSKFLELCDAHTKAKQIFKDYEGVCKELAAELWYNLAAYYEIPIDRIDYRQLNEYGAFERASSLEDWRLVMLDDANFEFGIGITIYEVPEAFPYTHHTIVLPFLVYVDDQNKGYFTFGNENKKFEVTKGESTTFRPLLDYVFSALKKEYEEGLTNMKVQNNVRTIGYK